MARRRVVITGIGILSPLGSTKEAFLEGLYTAKTKIEPSAQFKEKFGDVYAAEIKYPVEYPGMSPQISKNLDIATLWAYHTTYQALKDSNLYQDPLLEKAGLVIGVSSAGTEAFMPIITHQFSEISIEMLFNSGSFASICTHISSLFGIKGGFELVATACTASTNAIGLCWDAVQSNKTDVMVTIGTEPIYLPTFAGFYGLKAMHPTSCTPFSGTPGMSLGEGAGALIIEEYEHAKKRNAPIYGEILGYSANSDAYHETAPDPKAKGAVSLMKRTLSISSVEKEQIEYINAHGTGTNSNDKSETIALQKMFPNIKEIPVSSSKSFFGHNIGAAGVIELIVCLLVLPQNKIPPTVNFNEPRPGFDLDYVPNEFREKTVSIFMKNNYAFGGNNCSIVMSMKPGTVELKPIPRNQIVITGCGIVNSLGIGVETFWDGLTEGKSVSEIDTIEKIDTLSAAFEGEYDIKALEKKWLSFYEDQTDRLYGIRDRWTCSQANEETDIRVHKVPEFNIRDFVKNHDPRKSDKISNYALVALEESLKNGNLKISKSNRDEVGLVFGISKGPKKTIARYVNSIYPDPKQVKTFDFPSSLMNAIATKCAIAKNAKGYNTTLATGFSASMGALQVSHRILQQGHENWLVVGGTDELISIPWNIIYDFNHWLNTSTDARDFTVYGKNSQGFFSGEGAATLLIESIETARNRNSPIFAEIKGISQSADGGYESEQGKQLSVAIADALEQTNLSPWEIDLIIGSSWGAPREDQKEVSALKMVFGSTLKTIPLANYNPNHGLIESCNGLNAIIAGIGCLRRQTVFGNPHQSDSIDDDIQLVGPDSYSSNLNHILVTSQSEGGNNYVVILGKTEEPNV